MFNISFKKIFHNNSDIDFYQKKKFLHYALPDKLSSLFCKSLVVIYSKNIEMKASTSLQGPMAVCTKFD